MSRVLLNSLFWVLLLAGPAVASNQGEFYTENILLNRDQVFSNSLRLRESFLTEGAIQPYFQLGQECQRAFSKDEFTQNSHGYLSAGISALLRPAQFFIEIRQRAYYKNNSLPQTEGRSLLVLSQFWEKPIKDSTTVSLISEGYSELLFTTVDKNNLILAAYLRGGLRSRHLQPVLLDIFFEPYLTWDRNAHYYNNRADLKFTLRAVTQINSWQAGLQLSYLLNHYFSRSTQEINPFKQSGTGFRFLFTVGGSF